jgi:hypothetical protein
MTAWEEGYVPMRLRDRLRTVRVTGANGTAVPLVASEYEVAAPNHIVEATTLPHHERRNWLIGGVVGALFAFLGLRARRDRRFGVLLGGVGSLWAFVIGTLGVILLLAWVATRHQFWYANENLLLINPITLALAVLIPLATRSPRWANVAFHLAAFNMLLGCAALLLKVDPGAQHNFGVIVLVLPMHMGITLAMGPLRIPQIRDEQD